MEKAKDFGDKCPCGGKLRYVENLDIVDPSWKPIVLAKKPTSTEIIKNKIDSLLSIPTHLKNRFLRLISEWKNRLQRPSYANTYYNSPYGRGLDMGSIINELNLDNIQWMVVLPVTVAITLIYAFTSGIFTLLIFAFLILVGYLFKDRVLGIKNALITGTLSFFLGSLLTGSYLFLIPLTLVGAINGVVCGWIGGYLRMRR